MNDSKATLMLTGTVASAFLDLMFAMFLCTLTSPCGMQPQPELWIWEALLSKTLKHKLTCHKMPGSVRSVTMIIKIGFNSERQHVTKNIAGPGKAIFSTKKAFSYTACSFMLNRWQVIVIQPRAKVFIYKDCFPDWVKFSFL